MTYDAAHELQVAIVNALKADPDVAALVGNRIYDLVPTADGKITATFPYISFGPVQDLPEDTDCLEASELVIQLDTWSRDPGFMEGRKIAKAMKKALDDQSLSLADNSLVYFEFDGRRDLRAPDGLTTQIVSTYRAGIEHH
ncbi:DUF3168 domain-containing protein [Agrobacterium tumefaciens]|uniref:DUF3168 domain-containing protein n=1 Tax=Agrobacterium tumefaciens TaxID=358 RepID=A0AA44EZN6_AGRTU|nr:DUF3168 domain-containing protein [Agrobacterium tumefaciens]NSL22022.1 DUF3168 domain-containing protein [Agrobacterium tumefaciens]NTB85794.1 DUF3168 domain-containing protein [Agrobacterium tumefaciens]NTC19402.1 DUF3168 domain-containing protein [Agrobacterium tumefaciens]NTC26614.1 DUF3168 domain-containing protein [Agrobacterium tumefaciens]NTC57889.1 DUF3168 domain-containing protein [Agrobacterium tumefaciens]